ncbi:MAG: hypothetical protein IJ518_01490 [Clostridia bacterium]|nr:hypothetical protein [Clostridia bacterium]
MKYTKRILCTVVAVALLLSVMLTGCSMPKLVIGGTPDIAGTVGDREITTGEYLAYLYNTFNEMYYNQGLYYYEYYGMDPWTQEYTYGEGDTAKKVKLSEYISLQTQDSIIRQEALTAMLKEQGLSWLEEDEKKINEDIAKLEKDAYLAAGFSNENFIKSYKNLYLNERSLFYGLYGKGGKREVSEADQKKYFEENYLSYKIISIALTDSEGKELDEAGKKKITDELNGYLETYNKDKNFEAAVDAYNKANAEKDAKVEPSKDADNRQNVDAKASSMDKDLEEAIRSVAVGTAKIVTYSEGGKTPTAALILRLDINDPKTLFTDEQENIISSLKYEEFDKEVTEKAGKIAATFNKAVTKKCKPENFLG